MTAARARRINARLPPDIARKVNDLEKRTHKSTTEIVLASIDLYYEAMQQEGVDGATILERSGLIGSGRASRDLSSTYKSELHRSWAKKT